MKNQHGWHSAKSEAYTRGGTPNDKGRGPSVYSTPNGGEATVTYVGASATEHVTNWDDMVYIGPVDKWLRYAA